MLGGDEQEREIIIGLVFPAPQTLCPLMHPSSSLSKVLPLGQSNSCTFAIRLLFLSDNHLDETIQAGIFQLIRDSDKGVISFQVKPPGVGWVTPIPGNLPNWYDPMGWEGLKVFHYKLPTDVRQGLGTQQAMTADMGEMAIHYTKIYWTSFFATAHFVQKNQRSISSTSLLSVLAK